MDLSIIFGYNNQKHGDILETKLFRPNKLYISTKYGYLIIIDLMTMKFSIHEICESSFKFDIFLSGIIVVAYDNTIKLFNKSMEPFILFDNYVVRDIDCRSLKVNIEPTISSIITISNNLLITASENGLVKWWFYCKNGWCNLFTHKVYSKYVTSIIKLNDLILYSYSNRSIEVYKFNINIDGRLKQIKHELHFSSITPENKLLISDQLMEELYLRKHNSINLSDISNPSQKKICDGLEDITYMTPLINGCIMLCSRRDGLLLLLYMYSGKFYTLEKLGLFEHVKNIIISSNFDVIIHTQTKLTLVACRHSIQFYLKKELLKIVLKCCGVLDRDIDVTQILEFLSSIFKSRNILHCKNVFNACKNVFNDTNLYRQISEYI